MAAKTMTHGEALKAAVARGWHYARLREIAVRASCDPRTVAKVVLGVPVRGMAGGRVRRAIDALGRLDDLGHDDLNPVDVDETPDVTQEIV